MLTCIFVAPSLTPSPSLRKLPIQKHHSFAHVSRAWELFLKSPETFRAYFGYHNSLYILATPSIVRGSTNSAPRFYAIKLRNHLGFSYIKNMLKDQLFKPSELQFDNWLFGPEKFSGLSRNRFLAPLRLVEILARQ